LVSILNLLQGASLNRYRADQTPLPIATTTPITHSAMEQTQQFNNRKVAGSPAIKSCATMDVLIENKTEASPGFRSILFVEAEDVIRQAPPDFFRDLNLDQVVEGITLGKGAYDLKPFFYTPLRDIDAIKYRHEVFQDLEDPVLLESIRSFAQRMREMRDRLTTVDKLYYQYQKQRWFLDAAGIYCDAIVSLGEELSSPAVKSRGLRGFSNYLQVYVKSGGFTSLQAETEKLTGDLSAIAYSVIVRTGSFTVRKYGAEADYSSQIEKTFGKFRQSAVKDYRVSFENRPQMNHIEAKILEFVARLFPQVFANLDDYCQKNGSYQDDTIERFDREIQFYIAYLEYCHPIRSAGLKFCYPELSDQSKAVCNDEGFDLALANQLVSKSAPVVCNDFYLKDPERIFVVSGPNQGGKTTFARTFGQMHHLASIGCLVPGTSARLFLFDKILTHFERQENMANLRGKLQDDVIRIHEILEEATSHSLIIMNEIFTSTTLQDALFLSEKVIAKIIERDGVCVWVTFVDELASFAKQVVSMVSTVLAEDPTVRTFKVLRRPAAGLAYALSLAEKHRLTSEQLNKRVKP
jgi:DNA mismatch repair protein MutS